MYLQTILGLARSRAAQSNDGEHLEQCSERIMIPRGLVIIKYVANLPICIFHTFFLKVLLIIFPLEVFTSDSPLA